MNIWTIWSNNDYTVVSICFNIVMEVCMYPYNYSNGKKYNRRKLTYKKSHYKHLLPENNIRNYANWLKQEYALSCYPKHVRIKNTYYDFYYDLEYKYANRYPKHSSWKNKKFKYQYEHNVK